MAAAVDMAVDTAMVDTAADMVITAVFSAASRGKSHTIFIQFDAAPEHY
jgi:hypothetical protein